ncbi:hypothetical protein MPC1_9370002 [Methylocella tundrae]|uniref:hypothetical protein n=1 Tax=Methylocella tundrae TaxID=227605 RepID=UPI001313B7F9|nr:hypothetical protein [Methylocella tundrae]VTZ28510.1 hypothetical protein MPC1_9370002 [Methylocella tundrae]
MESEWHLSDKIAAITTIAALLQFIALIFTLFVMVRNGRRQLRAYVFPNDACIYEGTMLEPPIMVHKNKPGVLLNFRNCGQTPAYNVVSWADLEIAEPLNEEKLVAPKLEQKFPASLGANSVMSKTIWYRRSLTENEISDINNGAKAIYLFGRIEYQDAFKKKRATNFRLRYNGPFPPPKGVIFLHCEKGNDAN